MDLEAEQVQSVVENVETVEVVAGDDIDSATSSHGLIDQQMIVTHPQEILVPTTEVQIETQPLAAQVLDPVGQSLTMTSISSQAPIISIAVDPTSPNAQTPILGAKRSHPDANPMEMSGMTSAMTPDIPRKKSRNYLDSHKTIEKKRRDRINQCLDQLKSLVPDCKQYGSKKLDKAEILEMTIEYVQRMQNQGGNRGAGGLDLALSQRDWASDLTTWVIHNKLLYTGPTALEHFSQALLLHLQSMSSTNTIASAASILLNQAASNTDEDPLLRQQAQTALLQQLQLQASPPKLSEALPLPSSSSSVTAVAASSQTQQTQQQLQQAQLTQLQALLLLQQQLFNQQQQQQQETSADPQQSQFQQLQQLQQLQALLLQHIANESTQQQQQQQKPSVAPSTHHQPTSTASSSTTVTVNSSTGETLPVDSSVLTTVNPLTSQVGGPSTDDSSMELALKGTTVEELTAEETVYSSMDDNLHMLQVNVSQPDTQTDVVTSGIQPAVEVSETGQMWSAGNNQTQQSSSLLILGGESEGEGGGGGEEEKHQLSIGGGVHEEVVLLAQQEQ